MDWISSEVTPSSDTLHGLFQILSKALGLCHAGLSHHLAFSFSRSLLPSLRMLTLRLSVLSQLLSYLPFDDLKISGKPLLCTD